MMKRACTLILGLLGVVAVFAEAAGDQFPTAFNVTMLGRFVVPAVQTPANGKAYLLYSAALDSLTYEIHLYGLTTDLTRVAFHSTLPWQNGPEVLVLSGPGNAGDVTLTGRVFWPPELRPLVHYATPPLDLEVDTEAYPAGELRGQPEGGVVAVKATTWGSLRHSYH